MYVYFCERGDRVSRGGQLLFMYPFLFMYFFFPFFFANWGWELRMQGRRKEDGTEGYPGGGAGKEGRMEGET